MKKYRLLFFSLSLSLSLSAILASCGGKKETTQEVIKTPETKTETNSSGGGSAGGVDLGGGNLVNGKLIEDYRIMITEEPAYKEQVLPILDVLKNKFPELAADFYHIVDARKWYLIPVPLKTLDPFKIGIGFEIETQQAAYHFPDLIYISKPIWKTLDVFQQGFLITHEILMGVKWLEHHEGLERCLAQSKRILIKNDFKESTEYSDAKKECYRVYVTYFVNPAKFKLSGNDYDNIRTLTSYLYKFIDKINWQDLQDWFRSVKFREY